MEDALLELLRNARDAGARNVYVASVLRARRYRTLTVLDDGVGIPESYKELIFEPGVTTRHLNPGFEHADSMPHGAGLSLYHIKNAAIEARVRSTNSPTSIQATFDTRAIPERSLQSGSRPSRSNLPATIHSFLQQTGAPELYYSSPARILATLLDERIIQSTTTKDLKSTSKRLGLNISLRTAQRIKNGQTTPAGTVPLASRSLHRGEDRVGRRAGKGIEISLKQNEMSQLEAILKRAARSRYLELGDLKIETSPGEIALKASVYEPEEEYE